MVGLVTVSDGVDVKLSSFSLETVGRTVLSGAAGECATWGLSEGARGRSPGGETSGPGRIWVTIIDFRTDPVTARRHRVVSLVTHVDIPDIVWADDETGCYAGWGKDAKCLAGNYRIDR